MVNSMQTPVRAILRRNDIKPKVKPELAEVLFVADKMQRHRKVSFRVVAN